MVRWLFTRNKWILEESELFIHGIREIYLPTDTHFRWHSAELLSMCGTSRYTFRNTKISAPNMKTITDPSSDIRPMAILFSRSFARLLCVFLSCPHPVRSAINVKAFDFECKNPTNECWRENKGRAVHVDAFLRSTTKQYANECERDDGEHVRMPAARCRKETDKVDDGGGRVKIGSRASICGASSWKLKRTLSPRTAP